MKKEIIFSIIILANLLAGCLCSGKSYYSETGVDCLNKKNIEECRGKISYYYGPGLGDSATYEYSEYYTVVGNGDPYFCQIFSDTSLTAYTCFLEIAKKTKDQKKCDSIEDPTYKCECLESMGFIKGSEKQCIIYEKALNNGTDAPCIYEDYNEKSYYQTDFQNVKCHECFDPIAMRLKDAKICGMCGPDFLERAYECSKQMA